MRKTLKANTGKCPSCGGNMMFNPDTQSLFCNFCKKEKPIQSIHSLPKELVDNSNSNLINKNKAWLNQVKSMQCQNCGAKVILNNYQTSASCPYCASSLVVSNQEFDGLKPHSIIPFKFGRDKAKSLFKEKLKKKWFVSKKFIKFLKADEIQAYYFPAFIFDSNCFTTYSGRLYENVEDSDGNSSRRYFNINGAKQTSHANIEIEASERLSQFELNSIRPYNFIEAYAYTDEYIYGFGLEQHSNSVVDASNQAETIMKQAIRKEILSKYKYDGVSNFDMNNTFTDKQYSYCMLPIYRFNFSYKNNKYSNIMNGQTGKLSGNYPKSGWKIALIVLAVLMFIGLPFILFILFAIGIF